MKYLSTFSGIGGFELGIGEHHECVGYSEIDKYAVQIYQKHFPTHHNYGDITHIHAEELPDFDLLVGGFPCQSFSIAGKRGGFADTRGTMFFELARILEAKRPRLFVFENVKGLLSHDEGRTFNTIITTLDELGYDLQWQVLNSKNHGVPQNRERVFIIGHLRGTPRPQVFPFLGADSKDSDAGRLYEGNEGRLSQSEERPEEVEYSRNSCDEARGDSPLYERGTPTINQLNHPTHSNDRVYGADGISPTLNTMQGGNRQPFILARNQRSEVRKMHISGTVPASRSSKQFQLVNGVRRLTPTECERLQGFPDGWTEGVSDTQRYKTLGNAVTVNVIRDICEKLL